MSALLVCKVYTSPSPADPARCLPSGPSSDPRQPVHNQQRLWPTLFRALTIPTLTTTPLSSR